VDADGKNRSSWNPLRCEKNTEHRILRSDAPGLVPSPRYFAKLNDYCNTVRAAQVAVVVKLAGALPAAPGPKPEHTVFVGTEVAHTGLVKGDRRGGR
jgi:hypothetical protein